MPRRGPKDARALGVAMIYQELAIAPHLSVEANVMLGRERTHLGVVRRGEHRRLVTEALTLLDHPDIAPEAVVGSLSIGAQQLVEVARALVSDARVIVFDEPTSSLTERDASPSSRSSPACARGAWRSFTSATSSKRSVASRSGSRSCATAGRSPPRRWRRSISRR